MKKQKTFKRMLQFVSQFKIFFWVCITIYGSQQAIFSMITAIVNNFIARGIIEKDIQTFIIGIILNVVLTFALLLLIGVSVNKYCKNFVKSEKAIKNKVFKSFIYTSSENIDKTGNSIAAINTEADLANEVLSGSLAALIGAITGIVFPLAMLFFANIPIALLTLIISVVFFVSQIAFSKPLKNNAAETLETNRKAIIAINEYLSRSLIIRMYKLQEKSEREFDITNKKLEKLGLAKASLQSFMQIFLNFQTLFSFAGVIGIGSVMVAKGLISIPTLMLVPPLAQSIIMSAYCIGSAIAGMQAPLKASEKLLEMIDESELIENRDNNRNDLSWNKDSSITISNLSFRYKGSDKDALKDINLSIKEKEFISFVGESGCGKSTLLKVVSGLYERDEMPINIGNYQNGKVKSALWRSLFATVDQSSKLFEMTIEENIKLGALKSQKIKYSNIIEASKMADVDSFIINLPDGYNTDCGSAGSLLSGGQR